MSLGQMPNVDWFGLERRQQVLPPLSSVGKEFACSAGDPVSIPGLGRSLGEGIDYPL